MYADYQLIGLGTYKLVGNDCVQIIKTGLEIGYRLIDTAQLYKNHQDIKEGIVQSGISRTEIFITSKIHNKNITKLNISESISDIRTELGTDYLDLILLHNPVKNYELAWRELIMCQNHLNIRYIGVSNFYSEHLDTIIKKTNIKPWLNQIELNIFNQQTQLINYNKELNIHTQSHTTLTRNNLLTNENLCDFASELNLSVPELMFRYVREQDIGILPRTSNLEHLRTNWDTFAKSNIKIFNTEFLEKNKSRIKLFDIKYKLY